MLKPMGLIISQENSQYMIFPVFPDFLGISWCIHCTFLSLTIRPNNFNLKEGPLET